MTDAAPIPAHGAPSAKAPFISHAQNFEDVMLWRALHGVSAGRYLDVGAGEPDADSVTLAFYERGWRGVNIEPLPGPFARLQASRPRDVNLNLAMGAAPGETSFYVVGDETALSTMDPALARHHQAEGWSCKETKVSVSTLAEVCASHVEGELHFLKVDAEGAELDVLRGADFTRWRPWIVLLEAPDPALPLPGPDRWEAEVLTPSDYRFVWFDGLNRFYIAAEREAELAPAFRSPPNVFDGFVRAVEASAKGQLDGALAAAEAANARAHAAQERADEAQARVASAEARADDAQARVQVAQTDLDHAQSRVAAAEARADDAQAYTHAAQARVDEVQARLLAGDARLAAAEAARAEAEAVRDQLAARVTEAEAQVVALKNELARVAAERDGWAQELFETNRYAADLTQVRQRLLEEQARSHAREERRVLEAAAFCEREAKLQDHEARLLQEVAGLKRERDQARIAEADRERWLQAVRESLSWRLTRPMRVAGRLAIRRKA